jgi:hypothetical protein
MGAIGAVQGSVSRVKSLRMSCFTKRGDSVVDSFFGRQYTRRLKKPTSVQE